jgi:hypothetical protein
MKDSFTVLKMEAANPKPGDIRVDRRRAAYQAQQNVRGYARLFPQPSAAALLLLKSSRWSVGFPGLQAGVPILLGLLHAVTRDVQFQDYAVMNQTIDRGRCGHRVFENVFPAMAPS